MRSRIAAFFYKPRDPAPLGLFRLLIASFVLLQAIVWYPDWLAFLGKDGWVQWEISRALSEDWSLHLERVHAVLQPFGLSPDQTVMLFFWVYVAAGVGLLAGWHTRISATAAWLCHYILMSTVRTFTYGVDIFLHIALFYLMVMPVAKAYSVDVRDGRVSPAPTWGVTLALRVLQIHLCFVYLSAGFEKTMAGEWWDGNVIWRSFVQPDFRQFDFTWIARYPWMAAGMAWFTMLTETGYPIAMWIPRLRVLWLAAIVSLHLGIGLFLGLWFFGLIMILLSISAFGYDAYQDARGWIRTRSAAPRTAPASAVPEPASAVPCTAPDARG
jgi:HTTM domain